MIPGYYRQAMLQLASEIENLGVRAIIDPQAVNPPCVVIDPPRLERLSTAHYAVTHRIHVVAPGPGGMDALSTLDTLLEQLWDTDPDTVEPSTYTLGSTGEPVPALTITLERSL
jgi:hypothetical protein